MTHQPVEVTQSDVEIAANWLHDWKNCEGSGKVLAEYFAHYRIATEQAVIDRALSDGAVTAAGIAFYNVPPFHGRSINDTVKAAITAALGYRKAIRV
jgi:stage V sporulation protein SpoVS